ncbi:hypothetical protein DSO57_1038035 [Entomophthora muscae]|uniref:Uncharacterized protein n=1 Tax=Entomophthora muscae TaxID=34485 RepID=A0ACC2SYU3_9FUNG|nr:hypothetical protein DSO57_1038035 [Entomophthora muscae]
MTTLDQEHAPKRVKVSPNGLSLTDLEWLLISGGGSGSLSVFQASVEHLKEHPEEVKPENQHSPLIIEHINWLLSGEFEAVICSDVGRSILSIGLDSSSLLQTLESEGLHSAFDFYRDLIRHNVQDFFINGGEPILALGLGNALLNLFVKIGWTGPVSDLKGKTLLPLALAEKDETEVNRHIFKELSVDGEDAYHLAPEPLILWMSEAVLEAVKEYVSLSTSHWWFARALFIHQRLLDNPTGTLQETIASLMNEVAQKLPEASVGLSANQLQEIHARFHIESGLHNHLFYNDREAVERYKKAQEFTGLQWELTGALGKRTKFQQNDITQLVLLAKSRPDEELASEVVIPDTLSLNDDTLLEKISFTEGQTSDTDKDVHNQTALKPIDQSILLALCLNIKNTNPSHGLTTEQMMPYVVRVLENPANWMVHTMGLLIRSRLESHKSRTVERSVFQLQALVDQVKLIESTVTERLAHFYSLLMPATWEMEKELAERFMSLGVVRSALEIFTRLEMWEQAVQCHRMLEDKDKAFAVVEAQLALNPDSPKLLCLKGDVLADPEWWLKAWEVSNHRYARAMRALGSHYFTHDQFTESFECYLKALAINPLFESSWFICGCAAMRAENWEVAQRAFRKVTSLDPDNGEAWNNLASTLARQGRKSEAFLALQQALRQNYANWKMWSNFLCIALDLGHFSDAIRAMERVVDLQWESRKEKCVDREILSILINAVATDTIDSNGQGASRLRLSLVRLVEETVLGRIAGDPHLWQLAAKLHGSGPSSNPSRALECQLRAFRCCLNHPDLLVDHEVFSTCATSALDLIDAYANYGPLPSPEDPENPICSDWLYQSRLLLRNLISRTRDSFETDPEHDLLIKALEGLKNV